MDKKIAVVTGASSGIGKAVATFLADKNYFVILIARNEEKLSAAVTDIIAGGNQADFYCCDITDAKQVKTCINQITHKYQRIDLLFNNAGIIKYGTTDLADDAIDLLLKTNLNGAIYVAKYVAKQMQQQKSGYIINLSSIWGKVAESFAGIHVASKFGLSGFSDALAKQMTNYNVKVTNICPSMVATNMTKNKSFQQHHMLKTADITATIAYLLSLSDAALPLEILIHCKPFINKVAKSTYDIYGLDSAGQEVEIAF